jgi:uncharacterized protein
MPHNESHEVDAGSPTTTGGGRRLGRLLARTPWATCVLPFAVFMLLGSLEPRPRQTEFGLMLPYAYYPIVYAAKILLTIGAILVVRPGYKRFPGRVTFWGPLAGLAGIVLWLGICSLQLEKRLLEPAGFAWLVQSGGRSAYDPFRELGSVSSIAAAAFLAVRFFGLVVVVPLVEEFFLRGFVMPLCVDRDWWKVPMGTMNWPAVLAVVFYAVLTHPLELFAAVAWFLLVTLLLAKTRNIWDCVAAHAVTNALLGAYVLYSGNWELW